MSDPRFDIAVIGAGPAGLSAARTAARLGGRVIVLEKLARAGDLGHPCGAAVAPLPGFFSAREDAHGLHFPELDLDLPLHMITGRPRRQCYVSPSGYKMTADFPSRPDFPVVTIDKPALLTLLAEQAAAAGATLQFDSAVAGLLEERGAIVGIRTRSESVRARVVLVCEGVSRQFSEAAGFYGRVPSNAGYAFVAAEFLDAPATSSLDVGQVSTLGQRYVDVPRAFGTVVVPAPGKAEVYFSIFADNPVIHTDQSLWRYLESYKQNDPRIRHLLAGARSRHRSGCRMVLRKVPPTVVRDGLTAVGDSVGPGGHVGIMPCVFLGQAAAQTAMQAIKGGDVSARRLAPYDRLFHGRFLRGLETEGKIITSLTHMADDEIDRVCEALSRINLAPFFFGESGPILRTTVRWVATSLRLIVRDWTLIRRMLS